MIEVFKGNEIDKRKIATIKNIAYQSNADEIYDEYFDGIYDVKGLASLHSIDVDMENLVLGTDWFLCYSESNNFIKILEWVSVDNGNIFKQTVEMINIFKKLFIHNKEKYFIADMRHDIPYAMYLHMLERGYFQEFRRQYTIDCSAPIEIYDIKNDIIARYIKFEDFLADEDSKDYDENFEYILHHLRFMITNKFVEKHGKQSTSSQGPVLRKKDNK